jgi:hypothetical protein
MRRAVETAPLERETGTTGAARVIGNQVDCMLGDPLTVDICWPNYIIEH